MYENRLLCVEVQYPSDGVRILKRYPFRENQTFTISATEEADGRLLTVRMYDLGGVRMSARYGLSYWTCPTMLLGSPTSLIR